MKKQLWSVSYASLGTSTIRRHLVPTFVLRGELVLSQWHVSEHDSLRRYVEQSGVCVAAGCFRPEDGRPFFENLALSFSQSTTIYVLDVAEDGTP